jgi:hypothetical protein
MTTPDPDSITPYVERWTQTRGVALATLGSGAGIFADHVLTSARYDNLLALVSTLSAKLCTNPECPGNDEHAAAVAIRVERDALDDATTRLVEAIRRQGVPL